MTLRLRFSFFLLSVLCSFSLFSLGFGLLSIAPAVGAAIIGGLGSIAGGIIGSNSAAEAQEKANAMNLQISRENRNWQEWMTMTAHQREVADLKAAGLNPVLSAGGGGAATPTPNTPTMEPANAGAWANNIGPAINTALAIQQTQKDMEVKDAEIYAKAANSQAALASAQNSMASARATEAEMPSIKARASSAADEARLRASRSKFDEKMVNFDGYTKRVLDTIGGALDAVNIRRIFENTKGSKQDRIYREDREMRRNGRFGVPLP